MLNLDNQSVELVNKILLKYNDNITSAFYIGSRVKGDNHKFSDIDILIDTDSSTYSNLVEEFTNSDLHYFVDIVILSSISEIVANKMMKHSLLIELQ
jgi:predicted nucleotidyltransferase